MKKIYESPITSFLAISCSDVITASPLTLSNTNEMQDGDSYSFSDLVK